MCFTELYLISFFFAAYFKEYPLFSISFKKFFIESLSILLYFLELLIFKEFEEVDISSDYVKSI